MTGLKREVGLLPMICTAVGIVISSSALMMLGNGFGFGGPAFIVAMALALLINLCVAFSFSELSSLMPLAGGINHYTLPTMGPMIGIFGVLSGYLVVSVFGCSAEALIAGTVLADFFLGGRGNVAVIAAILMVLLTLINIRGVKAFAYSQVFMAATMIVSMVALSLIGLTGSGTGEPLPTKLTFDMAAGGGVLGLLGIAFWLFIGMEFVCPMAEEVRNPRRNIPLAMIIGLLVIFISNILFGLMAIRYIGLEQMATSPYPHVAAASAVLGRTGQIWIGIVSIVATGSTLNTYLAAIPRMLYGMAKEGQFPDIFAKTNRWGAPYAAIIFVCALSCVVLLFNSAKAQEIISLLILSSCICWIVVYLIAHTNVLILRKKHPDLARPFKVPFGWVLPIFSIIGLVYMVYSIWPEDGTGVRQQIYLYAFIAIVICFLWSVYWVKSKMKKQLFATTPIEDLIRKAEQTLGGTEEVTPKEFAGSHGQ